MTNTTHERTSQDSARDNRARATGGSALTDTAANRCPTCNSPDPKRHPAMQFEGEVQVCRDRWHSGPTHDEQAFLSAIESETTSEGRHEARCIYADWLDEQGRYDEATRQRKYEAADKVISEIVQELRQVTIDRHHEYAEEYVDQPEPDESELFTRESLLEMATGAFADDHWSRRYMAKGVMSFGGFESEMEHFIESGMGDRFWKAWATVTGNPFPEEEVAYSCAC